MPLTAILAGLAGFFSAVAAAMIAPVRIILLAGLLQLPLPLIGFVEGLALVAATLAAMFPVPASSRSARAGLFLLGYGVSGVARPLLGVASGWPAVMGLIGVDGAAIGLRRGTAGTLLAASATGGELRRVARLRVRLVDAGAVVGAAAAAGLLFLALGVRELILWTALPGALSLLAALAALLASRAGPARPDPAGGSARLHPTGPAPGKTAEPDSGMSRLQRNLRARLLPAAAASPAWRYAAAAASPGLVRSDGAAPAEPRITPRPRRGAGPRPRPDTPPPSETLPSPSDDVPAASPLPWGVSIGGALARVYALGGNFWLFAALTALFGLAASSESFLILRTAMLEQSLAAVALAYGVAKLVEALAAPLCARLRRRWSRLPVLVTGYGFFALVYAGWALGAEAWNSWLLFAFFGAYLALVRGAGAALALDLLPLPLQETGGRLFALIAALSVLTGNILAGLIWANLGHQAMFGFSAWIALLSFAIALAWLPWLRRVTGDGWRVASDG